MPPLGMYGCTQPLNVPRFTWCSLEQDPVRRALFRGRNNAEEPRYLAEVERGKRYQPPWRTVSHTQARCGTLRQRPHENNHLDSLNYKKITFTCGGFGAYVVLNYGFLYLTIGFLHSLTVFQCCVLFSLEYGTCYLHL
jgi:hypothetical protein